jgi:PAS domain S-box-containing protein
MTSVHLVESNSGSNSFLAVASLDQAAMDALPEAVYLCAGDGRVVRFNQKAVELWGRTPKPGDEERFCGSFRLYRTDGALLPHDQCPMAAALKTGECFRNQEVIIEQPSGQRLTVLANIAALKDEDGRVNGAINCLKEITDRRHAEAAPQDSERRFREIIDSLPAAIYTTDVEGRITHLNPAAAAFAGRAPELQDRVIGASKVARDITDRKKAELTLAERNLQLALAERAALVGSFAYDVDSETMQISAGYAAIHGFPAGAREILRSEWKAGVHHDDLVRLDEFRNHTLRSRSNAYSADYRIVRPGGEIRWIDARVFISYDADGRPQRLVGVNIDITGRKRAEEQQCMLRAELDHRVKNVLATVSAVATHTKNTSSSIDDFVAALDRRIHSMASTHALLSSSRWQGAPLRELIWRELAPYASNNNTYLTGPEVILGPEAAQTMASVLHELTTNAAKYGAFSKPEGRVSVRWHRAPNGQAPAPLVIEWLETGGPPVHVPSNSGYGRSVVTDLIPYELGGTAHLVFSPEGVRCRLDIPAKWLARAANERFERFPNCGHSVIADAPERAFAVLRDFSAR